MPSVLFVCTANLYRSPLAAAFFQKIILEKTDHSWIVDSAGTWTQPGLPPMLEAIRLARKYEADIEAHRSKQVDKELLVRFDLILGMEMGHKEALQVEFPALRNRIYSFSEAVDNRQYDIPDPFDAQGQIDNSVGVDIHKLITMKYKNIVQLTMRVAGPIANR
jgi:protein-tyrosine phosphatase